MIGARLGFMSPAVTYDTDAQKYITAVETADGQSLETSVRNAINTFVLGCKSDGIFTALKASCILMGARTLTGALTPLAGTAPTNVNFVSGDYNRKTGLIGNASTKYINTNRSRGDDGLNDQHIAVYLSAARSSGTHLFGYSFTDLIDQLNTGANVRNANIAASVNYQTATGLLGTSRTSATAWTYRGGGSTSNGPTSSTTAYTYGNIFVFARNNSGPAGYANARIAFYSIGSSVTLATLDSRVSTLSTAIAAAF